MFIIVILDSVGQVPHSNVPKSEHIILYIVDISSLYGALHKENYGHLKEKNVEGSFERTHTMAVSPLFFSIISFSLFHALHARCTWMSHENAFCNVFSFCSFLHCWFFLHSYCAIISIDSRTEHIHINKKNIDLSDGKPRIKRINFRDAHTQHSKMTWLFDYD